MEWVNQYPFTSLSTGITPGMFNFSVYFDFLLQVYWSILYKCTKKEVPCSSYVTSTTEDVRNDMNVTEDFFETVGVGHIIAVLWNTRHI